jgi:hypothetical protein
MGKKRKSHNNMVEREMTASEFVLGLYYTIKYCTLKKWGQKLIHVYNFLCRHPEHARQKKYVIRN